MLVDLGLVSRIEDWCARWAAFGPGQAAFAQLVLSQALRFDWPALRRLLADGEDGPGG